MSGVFRKWWVAEFADPRNVTVLRHCITFARFECRLNFNAFQFIPLEIAIMPRYFFILSMNYCVRDKHAHGAPKDYLIFTSKLVEDAVPALDKVYDKGDAIKLHVHDNNYINPLPVETFL